MICLRINDMLHSWLILRMKTIRHIFSLAYFASVDWVLAIIAEIECTVSLVLIRFVCRFKDLCWWSLKRKFWFFLNTQHCMFWLRIIFICLFQRLSTTTWTPPWPPENTGSSQVTSFPVYITHPMLFYSHNLLWACDRVATVISDKRAAIQVMTR